MKVTAISSKPFLPPKDDLSARLDEALESAGWRIPERCVVAVSSKVVAIGEGRCIPRPEGVDPVEFKDKLVLEEADRYVLHAEDSPYRRFTIIKQGSLIGNAGIDESNGNGYFILWPQDPMRSAREIRTHLMQRHGVTELGIIITDSTSTPLRNGVTGMTIGYAGFHALYDYRETPDIFGRLLKFERLNIADSLATAATLVMGEGNECTPFVLIEDVSHIVFTETESADPLLSLTIPMADDLFAPFIQHAPWRVGGKKQETTDDGKI